MSHFVFKAKKSTGEIYSSEKDVADRYELYKLVRESGDEIVEIREMAGAKGLHREISFGRLFGRVKVVEKINFARNLGSMLEAGLALSRALSVLERQARNKNFKKILGDLISEISKGSTFSDAMAKYPKVFNQLFVSMVRAGEQSGTLSDSLKVISVQMDKSYTLERKVKGALIYPGVIMCAMILIGILMFIFVVPTLTKTFVELNVTLPLSTRIVLGISDIFQNYGIIVLILFAALVGGFRWWARTASGKHILHAAVLKVPIIGSLVQEINTARTARTLSSLLGSGVDVVESVNITAGVIQNVHFRAVLEKAREAIKKGDLMSKVFAEADKLYPIFLSEMMSVGEETGKTGEMLIGVAHYYEDDVEQKTKDMSTVVEPFLMIIIAAAVGFFAISMISPMYSLVDAI
jgi:type IV pilus assembly protein PilC